MKLFFSLPLRSVVIVSVAFSIGICRKAIAFQLLSLGRRLHNSTTREAYLGIDSVGILGCCVYVVKCILK
jgi:hypothetical protein